MSGHQLRRTHVALVLAALLGFVITRIPTDTWQGGAAVLLAIALGPMAVAVACGGPQWRLPDFGRAAVGAFLGSTAGIAYGVFTGGRHGDLSPPVGAILALAMVIPLELIGFMLALGLIAIKEGRPPSKPDG